jgi:TolB-like protein/DNA-binding winged helix-turn-helix (wHTH) protein/Tfp pilus assembly protein PilF
LLDKEELMKALWPDSFVEEANLSYNVFTLRKALGEGNGGQTFVETIPKRGYRFVEQVREVVDEDAELIVREHSKSHIVVEQEDETKATSKYAASMAGPKALTQSLWVNRSAMRRMAAMALALLAVTTALVFILIVKKPKPLAADAAAKSIAVLPFKPLVADSRNESLELGMAESLINKLSPLAHLVVLPISAVRKYTSLEQDPITAGRELGVDYVLEGDLQMVGEKTRATARLLRVKDGSAIWTDKCDEKCSDIFTLQDTIAERIAGALAPRLTGEEKKQLVKHYTENTEAYLLYSLGTYYSRQQTKEGGDKGIEYFEQALKIDSNYALAYVGLTRAYSALGFRGFLAPPEARQRAEWAAQKAVALDDTLAEAHAMLAYIKKRDWDWAGAEKEFKRALDLDPNCYEANNMYSSYLVDVGRPIEGIPYAKRLQELYGGNSTGSPATYAAYFYFHARQYDAAIELYLKAAEWSPNNAPLHFYLGECYLAQEMYQEGVAELQKSVALENKPERWDRQPMLGYGYAVAGMRDEALKILHEQRQLAKHSYISPYNFAIIYIGLGDKDRAFEWLEKTYEERSQQLVHLKSRPMFDSLRSDPRYIELLRKMNLEP